MNYSEWNNRIAEHFFNAEMAEKSVYLYVTKELLNELGSHEGVDWNDFINALEIGPVNVDGKGICQKALKSMEHWKYKGGQKGYPLYIGYLALFVLAAASDDDLKFREDSYYPNLRKLLGDQERQQYPLFKEMEKLWKDLEQWSRQNKNGKCGILKIFQQRERGRKSYVGFPFYQALLSDKERQKLPKIFGELEFNQLKLSLLLKYGKKYLHRRTLRLLESMEAQDRELRKAIIEIINDEFQYWLKKEKEKQFKEIDESCHISIPQKQQKLEKPRLLSETNKIQGSLRLCCRLDTTAEEVFISLRCKTKTKQDFPENSLYLKSSRFENLLFCEEDIQGWSLPLRFNETQLNASQFDWLKGLELVPVDQNNKWKFKLSNFKVRVLVNGLKFSLPGLIEVKRIPRDELFYLIVHQDNCYEIQKWGNSDACIGFKEFKITKGLPENWHLFKVDKVYSSDLVKHLSPNLKLDINLQLSLEKGIKITRDNQFFDFAPPTIRLKAANDAQESIKVYCNHIILTGSNVIYELPNDVPVGEKLLIEVHQDKQVIKRKSLSLEDNFDWPEDIEKRLFDCFGCPQKNNIEDKSTGIIGALVENFEAPLFEFRAGVVINEKRHITSPTPYVLPEQKIIFIGREVGQIIKGNPPKDWSAVWKIYTENSFAKAIFCGFNIQQSEPIFSQGKNSKKLEEWQAFFRETGKTVIIDNPSVVTLWKKYQKESICVKMYR